MSKVGHFASECRSKNKINSVDENKLEGIYYIDLKAAESDSGFANNVSPKTEGKKLSKVNCEITSVDVNFLVDSGASVNIYIYIYIHILGSLFHTLGPRVLKHLSP